ncbi:MAG TPA: hypothetical protein VFG67_11410 [Oleiagrimonas sp.]|nr:hypothetical protein [Oleiagrimonas sp.]
MNLSFLPFGTLGVLFSALISLVAGVLLLGLVHVLGKRQHWSHAAEIGWAWLATMVLTAGADTWHLLYLGIVPLESPVTIARVLAPIHDPDTLGVRVVCEFIGASAGVMLGWLLWTGAWRHLRNRHDAA